MKKILLIIFIFFIIAAIVVTYFLSRKDPVIKDIDKIEAVADLFEEQLSNMGVTSEDVDMVIEKLEELNEETKYVVEVIVQNEAIPYLTPTLHLPVDEAIYNSVEIGQKVEGEMLQSLNVPAEYLNGWTIVVKNKIVRD